MSPSQTPRLVAVIPLADRPKAEKTAVVRRYVIAPAARPPVAGVRAP